MNHADQEVQVAPFGHELAGRTKEITLGTRSGACLDYHGQLLIILADVTPRPVFTRRSTLVGPIILLAFIKAVCATKVLGEVSELDESKQSAVIDDGHGSDFSLLQPGVQRLQGLCWGSDRKIVAHRPLNICANVTVG